MMNDTMHDTMHDYVHVEPLHLRGKRIAGMKVHALLVANDTLTQCGLEAWPAKGWHKTESAVTCKRCLKHMERRRRLFERR